MSIPGSRSLLNVLQGPVEFAEAKLQSFNAGTNGFRNYVRVSGRNATPTGIVEIRTNTRNGVVESREEVGEYIVMAVADHFLLVECQPNERRNRYVGGLKELPSDLQKKFFSRVSGPELKSATPGTTHRYFWARAQIDGILEKVFRSGAWVATGHSKELERKYRKELGVFVEEVNRRKAVLSSENDRWQAGE